MTLKANYHTHTKLCGHAVGDINDYIDSAISYGYEELGFSEHAPLPNIDFSFEDKKRLYTDEYISIETFKKSYLDILKNIKRNDISIKIGLETEYIEGYDSHYKFLYDNVSYLILGVHFFKYKDKFIDVYSDITNELMYEYANTIEKALSTGLFKYLAHPDLFLYDNIEFNEDALKVSNMIIDSCIKHNVYIEVNCNGKGRYPRIEFLKELSKRDIPVVIGVDCHNPNRLNGEHIDSIIKIVKDLNIKIIEKIEV